MRRPAGAPEPMLAHSSLWVRAHQSGVLRSQTALGARVREGDVLGIIADPFRNLEEPVRAPSDGLVIGRTNLPLVTEGEALYHVARFGRPEQAAAMVERFQSELDPDQDLEPEAQPPIV